MACEFIESIRYPDSFDFRGNIALVGPPPSNFLKVEIWFSGRANAMAMAWVRSMAWVRAKRWLREQACFRDKDKVRATAWVRANER